MIHYPCTIHQSSMRASKETHFSRAVVPFFIFEDSCSFCSNHCSDHDEQRRTKADDHKQSSTISPTGETRENTDGQEVPLLIIGTMKIFNSISSEATSVLRCFYLRGKRWLTGTSIILEHPDPSPLCDYSGRYSTG